MAGRSALGILTRAARQLEASARHHAAPNGAALTLRGLCCHLAAAAAADDVNVERMDKILLQGLVFHGYHGVLPEVWV